MGLTLNGKPYTLKKGDSLLFHREHQTLSFMDSNGDVLFSDNDNKILLNFGEGILPETLVFGIASAIAAVTDTILDCREAASSAYILYALR